MVLSDEESATSIDFFESWCVTSDDDYAEHLIYLVH